MSISLAFLQRLPDFNQNGDSDPHQGDYLEISRYNWVNLYNATCTNYTSIVYTAIIKLKKIKYTSYTET